MINTKEEFVSIKTKLAPEHYFNYIFLISQKKGFKVALFDDIVEHIMQIFLFD